MFKLALKNAIANRKRFGLTAFAVVISVAFLTATLILSDSMTGTASDDVADANAAVDLVVRGDVIAETEGGPGEFLSSPRTILSGDTVDVAESVDGVADAHAVVTGFAKLALDGEPLGSGTAADIGSGWIANPELNPWTLVDGSAPVGSSQVAIDRATADGDGLAVGQTIQVLTSQGTSDVEISGIATYGGSDRAHLQNSVLFDNDVAADVLGSDSFSLVLVDVVEGGDTTAVRASLDELITVGSVYTGSEYISEEQDAATSPFTFLSIFLLAFAVVATLVGATLIYNTFSIAIAQRRREMALMRAVGAERRDVLRTVMAEAAFVAIASTALGLGFGLIGVDALSSLMSALGLTFLDGPTVVSSTSIAIAATTGVVITLASAWFPARRAASAAPIEALRESTTEEVSQSRWRGLIGVACLLIGVGAAVVAALQGDAMLLTAAALLIPGLVLAGPTIVSWSVMLMRPVARRLAGVEGAIATTNLDRNPRRASSTTLALTLGVALVGFFSVLGSSIGSTVSGNLDDALQADQVVTSLTPDFATIDPGLADELREVDGVDTVASLRQTTVGLDGGDATIAGVDLARFTSVFDVGVLAGSIDDLSAGGVAVVAANLDEAPAIGEVVSVVSAGGVFDLDVVAVVENSTGGFDAPTHFVANDVLAAMESNLLDIGVFVSYAEGSSAQTRVTVQSIVAGTPGSLLVDRSTYIEDAGSEIDLVLNLVYAMLALTVLIAVVGIANTTTLAISERTKEIGLLRAIGTTVGGVRRVIQIEALVMSVVGTALGLMVGVGGAWSLVKAAGGSNISEVSMSWLVIALVGIAGTIGGLGAASIPARTASRRPTLEALAS